MIIRKLLHIAPTLPPVTNGLGDFCRIVAENLQKAGFAEQAFLIKNGSPGADDHVCTFTPESFLSSLQSENPDVVLLHYVGYAYDKYGIPFYLVRGLRRYKRETGCRILVFFHELFATGRSLFTLPTYTCRFQKLVVRQLCSLSDSTFTNCGHYVKLLREVTGNSLLNVICSGIFSNIPDYLYSASSEKEDGTIVVFGSLSRRKSVYENPRFRLVLQRLRIDRIYDIGPGEYRFSGSGVSVIIRGILPPEEIAAVLNRVKYGALVYKPYLLGKSGIFAAYTAFGVIPVNLVASYQPLGDGLAEGMNYFSWDGKAGRERFTGDTVRTALLDWYNQHNQRVVSLQIAAELSAHHNMRQTVKADNNVDTLPMGSFSKSAGA